MTTPIRFNTFVKSAMYLQEYDLVSRGILDTLGAAIPIISLARTPQERKEKILARDDAMVRAEDARPDPAR